MRLHRVEHDCSNLAAAAAADTLIVVTKLFVALAFLEYETNMSEYRINTW